MGDRPTVRVLCLDGHDRVLLLGWRDPLDGSRIWDLPGGGIRAAETPLAAARRELREETGLPGSSVVDRYVVLWRDNCWNGVRYIGPERCYLAIVGKAPRVSRAGLEPHEQQLIEEYRWVVPALAHRLPGRVHHPRLQAMVARLCRDREGNPPSGG